MRILVIGSGGREHALAWKISQSPLCESLWIAPGNPGTAQVGENVALPIREHTDLSPEIIDIQVDRQTLRGFLRSTAAHSRWVNFGTKPHHPPVAALVPYARLRGIDPWALAKTIAKRGTKAQPFFDRGSEETQAKLREELPSALRRGVQRAGRDRG